MNVIDALKWRYATKEFDPSKKVSNKTLETILEAFNLTATSYGLQPIKLLVIEDKTKQKELVAFSMNQVQVAQASHVLVFCIDTLIDKKYIESYFNLVKKIRNTPDAILDPFKHFLIEDFEKKEKQEILNWAVKQAYLAMGNLLTVCALEGVDACPMEGFTNKDYDKILNLSSKNLSSVLVMPIGYRAENDYMSKLKKVRKELKDSVIKL
ncbi:NAD(P)H-dependent oxidoreductase [Lacinutrix sp. MedPE-SW]|uniref:NAD(P)H-dependent oxidoreductase n=1 Tax=Lacinutrix sp. MedPE-SW TaxID=1860087 RepID=UPI00091C5C60|nr:NAD(P)H-dependent oxidoreductase [Lacinutrix sp. MedPE-SW]OIQ24053.1 MAG: NAD(P)H-dependent oxidoreductase [Lacinutrix sp. MedPE-SW]